MLQLARTIREEGQLGCRVSSSSLHHILAKCSKIVADLASDGPREGPLAPVAAAKNPGASKDGEHLYTGAVGLVAVV